MQQLRLFLTALQFFTRIPVPRWVGHTAAQLDQSARYFPFVGALVGMFSGLVLWLAAQALPLSVALVLSMVAGIWLTGAFHEDGLSDYADGMGGGYTREKILAIMKDSRVGAYGVIALVLVLLLKYAALLELTNRHTLLQVCAMLVAANALSRLLALGVMWRLPYVRADETARAKPVAQQLSAASAVIALLTGMLALTLLYFCGVELLNIISMLFISLVLLLLLARQMHKQLGGYTGDCLGAVQQITEVGLYLGLLLHYPR
jgi:adenosylcobinamide-GDP ribazoletransferase